MVPVPVTPTQATVTTVTTSGTAVTAFEGPCNGFLLQAGGTPIYYSLTGVAGTTVGGGTFMLSAGSQLLWDNALTGEVSLSVNASTNDIPFACARW